MNSERLKQRLEEIDAPADVKALAAELCDEALHDSLTGLFNRRFFDEALVQQIETAMRYKRDLSLVLFDLDGLKKINDDGGHAAGDEALRTFANHLRQTARQADLICRIGGDEFAVILPETPFAGARRFVDRLPASPAASCGIAALPSENLPADADAELLRKKRERE